MVVTHTLGRTKSDLCCANGPCRSDVWTDFTTVCLHNDSFRQFDLQIAATALNQLFFFPPPLPVSTLGWNDSYILSEYPPESMMYWMKAGA